MSFAVTSHQLLQRVLSLSSIFSVCGCSSKYARTNCVCISRFTEWKSKLFGFCASDIYPSQSITITLYAWVGNHVDATWRSTKYTENDLHDWQSTRWQRRRRWAYKTKYSCNLFYWYWLLIICVHYTRKMQRL